MSIGPSTETSLQLTQTVRTRLGQPYTNCTDHQHVMGDNTSDVYTQRYCVNICIQQKVVEQCGCVSHDVPQYTMTQLRRVNFHVCANKSWNNYVHFDECADSVILSDETKCNAACVLPCSEFKYEVIPSVAPWPRLSALDGYSHVIGSHLRFRYLFNLSANATSDKINDAIATPAAIDFIKANFLQLNLQFGDKSFVEL